MKEQRETAQPSGGSKPKQSNDSGGAKVLPLRPDPEVDSRAARRAFTAAYKLRIVREADACAPGEVGALLRREGLYSSHLTKWRRQREQGEFEALAPKKRGRKPEPAVARVAELERENRQLRRRLEQAETIIDVQKKISTLLGIPVNPAESDETD